MTNRIKLHRGKSAANPHLASRAGVYVRMSRDGQKYSIGNQMRAIRKYAEQHNLTIVKIYRDSGKSGLTVDGRDAFVDLVTDVIFRRADFSKVLVYDVSRWGRFQDLDESAHWDFLCKEHGVRVVYCTEPFQDDDSSYATVHKTIKRAFAADDSKIKGARVHATLCHMASKGLHPGGRAAYGMTRAAVDERRTRKQILEQGMQRSMRSDHVVQVIGRPAQVKIVREIFNLYVLKHQSASAVAKILNARGVPSPNGGHWCLTSIIYILENELYTGVLRYNRTSARLKTKLRHNDRSEWIVVRSMKKGIVDEALYKKAQKRVQERRKRKVGKPNDQLLAELKVYVAKHGADAPMNRRATKRLSSPTTYRNHFGSIRRAYELIGTPKTPYVTQWDRCLRARQVRTQILDEIKLAFESRGHTVALMGQAHAFRVGGIVSCYLDMPFESSGFPTPTWRVRLFDHDIPDYLLAGLMQDERQTPVEYYLIPGSAVHRQSLLIPGRGDKFRKFRMRSRAGMIARLVERATPILDSAEWSG